MKSLQLFLVASLLFISSVAFAGNSPSTTNSKISNFISTQLQNETLVNVLEVSEKVKIEFKINSFDEIVVMETSTNDRDLDRYIKNRLNYEELSIDGSKKNTSYFIEVEFKKESR